MHTMGMEMSVECKGLPLALVVLGGILANKKTPDEWKKVRDNIDFWLKNGRREQDNYSMLEMLELSYYDLPHYLKPCFLYLGIFPEDFEIKTKTLYRMWIMEGLVAKRTDTEEVPVESIAEEYLNELIDRCLLQFGTTGKTGRIKSCRLHDLVRDMCLKKSKEENFLHVIEHGDFKRQSCSSSSPLMDQGLRRMAIYINKSSSSLHDLIADLNTQHVRSLLIFPAGEVQLKLVWTQGTMSETLKLVRILVLEDICIRSLPREIGDLIHLKYLSVKGTRVRKLPVSIYKLRYLQILDLRVCKCIDMMIPDVIWMLKSLKYLHLPNNWKVAKFSPEPGWMRSLPVKILIDSLLGRLRQRSPSSSHFKLRLGALSQLETLENVRLEECEVPDLLKLATLHRVTLADYVVTEKESLQTFLQASNIATGQLEKPLSLAVDANLINKDPSILASNPKLQFHRLEISGKIRVTLSFARIFPENLKQLTLNKCELEEDPMPILEKLPQLTELTLGEDTFLGTQIECTAGNFPQLAILRLVKLTNLEHWVVKERAMARLKSLYLYSCRHLRVPNLMLPEGINIIRRD